jgi:hypothetical protein
MNLRRHLSIVAFSIAIVVLFSISPAQAQHRGGGGASSRSGSTRQAGPSRQVSPSRQAAPSHVSGSQQRFIASPRIVASPQAVAVPRPSGPRGPFELGRRPFSRPYYSFRPRFPVGLGLFVGYPIAFPYSYAYGYPYSYGYPDPYYSPYYPSPYLSQTPYTSYAPAAPEQNYVNAAPGAATTAVGGVSLDIKPSTAAVFLDGVYVGIVEDFSPTQPPLRLPSGKHRLEVRAQGYASLAFDVTVVAGQVTPFQGTMQIK